MNGISDFDDGVADSGEGGEHQDGPKEGALALSGGRDAPPVGGGSAVGNPATPGESVVAPAQGTAGTAQSAGRSEPSSGAVPTEQRNSPDEGAKGAGSEHGSAGAALRGDSEGKPGDIKSVLMLLEFAYLLKGKQVKIPQATFQRIASDVHEAEADARSNLARLLQLSAGDPLLAVPPRLLAAIETSNESVSLRKRLIDLLLAALAHHRVFRSEKVRSVLSGESSHVDDALRSVSLASTDATAEELGLPQGQVKATERERLRVNAITSLALLLSSRDAWSVSELVERLEAHLWREVLKKSSIRPGRVAVTESPGLDSLGVVARAYQSQVDLANRTASEADERLAAAERHVQMATARANESEARKQDVESALAESEAENTSLRGILEALRAEIDSERRDRIIDKSHYVDDYEALRTRVTRVLDRQVDLLADGLHALKNGSNAVTEEYIERSVDALNKELEQLRDEGDDQ